MPSAQPKSNLKAESTIFDPAQHYISFSAVVDSSAPNGAPTFDGRRTLNGNEIAAMPPLPLPLPLPLPRSLAISLSQPTTRRPRCHSLARSLALGTSKTAADDSLKSDTLSHKVD